VVGATGTTPLSYQWQLGTNLLDGATNSLFTITNAQMSDRGSYSVIVTNIAGSVISSGAVLTVTQPGFANIISAGGGSFILSGAGGTRGGIYYVLTATNLTLPFTNWTPIATDRFDNLGGFTFTNAAPANAPQLFYLLQQP
jgi:hypothetical protein